MRLDPGECESEVARAVQDHLHVLYEQALDNVIAEGLNISESWCDAVRMTATIMQLVEDWLRGKSAAALRQAQPSGRVGCAPTQAPSPNP